MSDLGVALAEAVGVEHVEPLSMAPDEAPGWRVTPGSAAEVAEVIRRVGAANAAVYPLGSGGRATRS